MLDSALFSLLCRMKVGAPAVETQGSQCPSPDHASDSTCRRAKRGTKLWWRWGGSNSRPTSQSREIVTGFSRLVGYGRNPRHSLQSPEVLGLKSPKVGRGPDAPPPAFSALRP